MKCKKDICILCEQEHNNHKIINDGKLIPNIDKYKNRLKELRESIDKLKENINEIIDNLNKVIENMEIYYKISEEIINNYDNKNINYEILYNINNINISNDNIIKEINNINNDNNINNRFNKINNIYKKIYDKIDEITIIYNIKDKEDEIRIFGSDFVENNKDKCNIIYEDEIYELTEYFKLRQKSNTLKIKLKGIKNITNISSMFNNCSSLSSLPDISKWKINNAADKNYLFKGCLNIIYSNIVKTKFIKK
jgi:surface protein